MSRLLFLKNRFFWGVLCGLMIGCLFGPPHQVLAQTRTSLASLQAAIDQIFATYIPRSGGVVDRLALSNSLILSSSEPATSANAGTLRFFNGRLELSTGGSWRTLAFTPVEWTEITGIPADLADGDD